MLHVCNAIDRISCYFDFTAEVIAERSFRVILSVQIRFLHVYAPNYMIWHHDNPNWTSRHIFWRTELFPCRTCRPSWKHCRHLKLLRGTCIYLEDLGLCCVPILRWSPMFLTGDYRFTGALERSKIRLLTNQRASSNAYAVLSLLAATLLMPWWHRPNLSLWRIQVFTYWARVRGYMTSHPLGWTKEDSSTCCHLSAPLNYCLQHTSRLL